MQFAGRAGDSLCVVWMGVYLLGKNTRKPGQSLLWTVVGCEGLNLSLCFAPQGGGLSSEGLCMTLRVVQAQGLLLSGCGQGCHGSQLSVLW